MVCGDRAVARKEKLLLPSNRIEPFEFKNCIMNMLRCALDIVFILIKTFAIRDGAVVCMNMQFMGMLCEAKSKTDQLTIVYL